MHMNLIFEYQCYLIKVYMLDPECTSSRLTLTYEVFVQCLFDVSRVVPDQGSVSLPPPEVDVRQTQYSL